MMYIDYSRMTDCRVQSAKSVGGGVFSSCHLQGKAGLQPFTCFLRSTVQSVIIIIDQQFPGNQTKSPEEAKNMSPSPCLNQIETRLSTHPKANRCAIQH